MPPVPVTLHRGRRVLGNRGRARRSPRRPGRSRRRARAPRRSPRGGRGALPREERRSRGHDDRPRRSRRRRASRRAFDGRPSRRSAASTAIILRGRGDGRGRDPTSSRSRRTARSSRSSLHRRDRVARPRGGALPGDAAPARSSRSRRSRGSAGGARIPRTARRRPALTTFLESLRNRLTRLGVSVVTVKPGFIDDRHAPAARRSVFWVISAEECAELILAGADAPPPVVLRAEALGVRRVRHPQHSVVHLPAA